MTRASMQHLRRGVEEVRPAKGSSGWFAGFRARIVASGPASEPDYGDARYWVREVILSYDAESCTYMVTYGTLHLTATNMTEFGSGVQIGGGDQTYGFGNHALLDYPRRVLEALAEEANAGPNPPNPPWTWADVPIEDVMPIFVWVTANPAGGYTFERYPEPSFQRNALDVPCLDASGEVTCASKWWDFDPRSANPIDDGDGVGITMPECGA